MQNFAKEEVKSQAEKVAVNRGYWGYQEMTEEETQKTTGAGCGGCGGCGGGDSGGDSGADASADTSADTSGVDGGEGTVTSEAGTSESVEVASVASDFIEGVLRDITEAVQSVVGTPSGSGTSTVSGPRG